LKRDPEKVGPRFGRPASSVTRRILTSPLRGRYSDAVSVGTDGVEGAAVV